MTPLERLLAEAIPDGTFGGPRYRDPEPAPQQPARPRRETSALEAAEHRRILEAALDQMDGRGTSRPERHLHPVPDRPVSARPHRKAS
jgi:hypothetical protein